MLEEKLKTYLLDQFHGRESELLEFLAISKLRLITIDMQKDIDVKFFMKSKVTKLTQKRFNQVHEIAIREFLNDCEQEGLEPLFVKGLFLGLMLYDDREVRSSYDIDIIIEQDEFYRYDELFKRNDYVYDTSLDHIDKTVYAEQIKHQHICYVKEVQGTLVKFEVHAAIVYPYNLFQLDQQDFMQHTKQVELLGMRPRLLELEYSLMYSCLHFIKHFPAGYFQQAIFHSYLDMNFLNLHDIAKMIERYGNEICWEKFVEIARHNRITKYVLFITHLVNEIYGELFPAGVILQLEANRKESYIASDIEERYGCGKFLWLMNLYFDDYLNASAADLMSCKIPDSVKSHLDLRKLVNHRNEDFLEVRQFEDVLAKTQESFLMPNQNHEETKVDLQVNINWKGVQITYRIKNKAASFYEPEGQNYANQQYYNKDAVELIVVRQHAIIHRMFILSRDQNEEFITLRSFNFVGEKKLELQEVNYRLMIGENETEVQLEIPWYYLDIDPYIEKEMPMNIAGLVSDPITGLHYKLCNLFNKDHYVWDFRGHKTIRFLSDSVVDEGQEWYNTNCFLKQTIKDNRK